MYSYELTSSIMAGGGCLSLPAALSPAMLPGVLRVNSSQERGKSLEPGQRRQQR